MSLNTINRLLKQSCTLSTKGAQDMHGKTAFTNPVTVFCRFQKTHRTIVSTQNVVEPIDGLVWLPADTDIEVGYKVNFDSIDYRVMRVEPMVDGGGNVRHIEALVQKWNV